MLTDIIIEDDQWNSVDFADLAERAATASLQHLALDPSKFEIAVLACGDTRIAELNTEFRDKPTPTNVLSWPSDERGADIDGGVPAAPELLIDAELGDIAISFDTCAREAAAANKVFSDHVTHLVVHGVLHLLGYDHIRDLDATLMEELEGQILGSLGLDDPYKI